jgi:phage gp37-like protein
VSIIETPFQQHRRVCTRYRCVLTFRLLVSAATRSLNTEVASSVGVLENLQISRVDYDDYYWRKPRDIALQLLSGSSTIDTPTPFSFGMTRFRALIPMRHSDD